MKRFVLLILCIASIVCTICVFLNTYSKYSNVAEGTLEKEVGKWIIKVNDDDINDPLVQEFTIENIQINGNEHVATGHMAPGISGYFDIEIDPTETDLVTNAVVSTDVSIVYDITMDMSSISNTAIQFTGITELGGNELIQTDVNTYSGIITLDKMKDNILNNEKNTIRLAFAWANIADGSNDGADAVVGSVANAELQIPITVTVKQYLGETVEPYIPD